MNMKKKIFTLLAAVCGLVYVNAADVTTYADLKAALGGGDTEIRVAVGLYLIDEGDDQLVIPAGKTVTGGYTDNFARRIYPGEATSNDEMTILDGNSLRNTSPDDKHRVATVEGILEGCLIRNGHANRGENGGGVLINDGGTVQNCIIKGNVAMDVSTNDALGGGAYLDGAEARLINCVVAFNMANNGYGVAGNGQVINNTITANTYAPFAVEVAGATYQHFKHWRKPGELPWTTFSSGDLDIQAITVSDFWLSQTQTTTSQYAVFAAAMDLKMDDVSSEVSFAPSVSIDLSTLVDPTRNDAVGMYMNFNSSDVTFLFKGAGQSGFGLQKVGNDYIYYPSRQNEAVTFVNWYGALAYSLWVGGSLPTEGQWELAARSDGTGTPNTKIYAGSETVDDVAWHVNNTSNRVQEVAMKSANDIGLYDMNGNVWEWCADFLNIITETGAYPDYTHADNGTVYNTTDDPIWRYKSGDRRAYRGGGWASNPIGSQSVPYRSYDTPANAHNATGFRPVLVP